MQKTVYPPDKFYTSELIDIGAFLSKNKITDLLPAKPYPRNSSENETIKNMVLLMNMELEKELYHKLVAHCSPDGLTMSHKCFKNGVNPLDRMVRRFYQPLEITDDARKFQTISRLEQRIKTDTNYAYKNYLKYQNNIFVGNCETNSTTDTIDLIPGQELLITIRIYRPLSNTDPQLHLSHDLVVLGSHTLDYLRDNINCLNDLRTLHDVSETPNKQPNVFTRDIFKSAFLFIEDTFYNDTREKDNVDNSQVIINWAANKKDIGPLKTESMETTTFKDLKVHLGYPQVYQHQGCCEHIFVFSDIEILQPSNSCCTSSYPHYKVVTQSKAIYCNMCGRFVAKWLVQNSTRMPFEPAYFCDDCFTSYNYIDGKKVENFKAYPIYNKESGL